MAARRSSFQAIGTLWNIQVGDEVTDQDWVEAMERVCVRIQAFDKAYSRFRADSLITRMSHRAGSYGLPPDGSALLSFYKKLYDVTEGRVTPLIGQVMSDAGYDAAYSFTPGKLSEPPTWEAAISFTDKEITLKQPALLDFGAAGKGYLVDMVSDTFVALGIASYTIDAGGDILHRSVVDNALAIGMENPLNIAEAIGIVDIKNQSICASAGSKRKWGKYHHIIDPVRLQSPQKIMASWVIADSTMAADGLATALFFTEPEVLARHFTFSYAVLHADMSLRYSKNFPVKTFKVE